MPSRRPRKLARPQLPRPFPDCWYSKRGLFNRLPRLNNIQALEACGIRFLAIPSRCGQPRGAALGNLIAARWP
jgi:hypothetical protein